MTAVLAPHGGRQLFIYWRVAQSQRDAALAALHTWQLSCMRDQPGLVARLYLRAEAHAMDGAATVMETYAGAMPEAGIVEHSEQHLRVAGDAASAAFRLGPRQVEVFDEWLPPQSTKRPASSRS